MKIELPSEPVDGYEIKWFHVENYSDIREGRLVYRKDKAWQEVYPGDKRNGARFKDEWQVFEDDRYTGRVDEWNLTKKRWAELFEDGYETRNEALLEAKRRTAKWIARLEADLRSANARLEEISRELAP